MSLVDEGIFGHKLQYLRILSNGSLLVGDPITHGDYRYYVR